MRRGSRQAEGVAERVTPLAERVAPAFKAGTLAVMAASPAAGFVPLLAPLPPQFFLPVQIAAPLFLFSQPFREGVRESIERDAVPAATSAGVNYLFAAVSAS